MLTELRRVAGNEHLSVSKFAAADTCVSHWAISARFGGWNMALERAGVPLFAQKPRAIVCPRELAARRSAPEPNTGCWLWLGALDQGGYAIIHAPPNGKRRLSRAILGLPDLRLGQMAHDNILALHRCDTPACVNPDHLFAGTHHDNLVDSWRKKRRSPNWRDQTHCRRGHALTPENIYRGRRGVGLAAERLCRECRRARQRKQNQHRRQRRPQGGP